MDYNLVLVRHGQSMGQLDQGAYADDRTNFLSSLGQEQSFMCADHLLSEGFAPNVIISSRYTRALQTGRNIQVSNGWNCEFVYYDQLVERRHWYVGTDVQVETSASISERVKSVLELDVIPRLIDGEKVMMTSHFHVMSELIKLMGCYGVDEKLHFRNAWPYKFRYENGEFVRLDSNQVYTRLKGVIG